MESGTYQKTILLFPPITFALTFLKINTDKSINDLLALSLWVGFWRNHFKLSFF